MEHRRAKLSIEGRRLLIERIRFAGWPVARAAEAQGVSRATAQKWLRRYDDEGWDGLVGRSSAPHRCPHRLSPEREQAILARREATLHGPHRIAWATGEARSTVWRVLRRHGVPRLAELDRATRTVVRYQRERPGELLHVDVKKQGRIPDGGGWRFHGRGNAPVLNKQERRTGDRKQHRLGYDYLHIAVDDRSRIAYVEAHRDERKDTAAGFMTRAIDWFADHDITIERVMADNGNCYRSLPFRDALQAHQVRHLRTRPYRPQTNGKVERFNLTLKNEWAYTRPYTSNQARLDTLEAFVHDYNHHRGHTAHNGGAPMSIVDNVPVQHKLVPAEPGCAAISMREGLSAAARVVRSYVSIAARPQPTAAPTVLPRLGGDRADPASAVSIPGQRHVRRAGEDPSQRSQPSGCW